MHCQCIGTLELKISVAKKWNINVHGRVNLSAWQTKGTRVRRTLLCLWKIKWTTDENTSFGAFINSEYRKKCLQTSKYLTQSPPQLIALMIFWDHWFPIAVLAGVATPSTPINSDTTVSLETDLGNWERVPQPRVTLGHLEQTSADSKSGQNPDSSVRRDSEVQFKE